MHKIRKRQRDAFEDMDRGIKITDLASILSVMLDVPFPYSNLGIMHPAFMQTSSLKEAHSKMLENIE